MFSFYCSVVSVFLYYWPDLGGACTNSFDPSNPAASGFNLIFSDNFPGTSLDETNWCPNCSIC
jgi:hypothetical protein